MPPRTDRFPFEYVLAGDRVGLVLCVIPKCASTSLQSWFVAAEEGPDHGIPDARLHRYCKRKYALSAKPADISAELLQRRVKVAIVRDPLERLASAFASKFVSIPPPEHTSRRVVEIVQRGTVHDVVHDTRKAINYGTRTAEEPACSTVDYDRGITFREFLDHLVATPDPRLDPHWRPQSNFLSPIKFDLIGTVDHLGWTLQQAVAQAGLSIPTPPTRTPQTRRSGQTDFLADTTAGELRSRGIRPTVDALYDDELRTLARARYARDVDIYAAAMRPPAFE